jgi:hypothetical protein
MFVPDFARWPEFRSRLAAFTELLSEGRRGVQVPVHHHANADLEIARS